LDTVLARYTSGGVSDGKGQHQAFPGRRGRTHGSGSRWWALQPGHGDLL